MELDLSSMNKEERHDLAEHIRLKLQMRKKALNRRKASDDSNEDDWVNFLSILINKSIILIHEF